MAMDYAEIEALVRAGQVDEALERLHADNVDGAVRQLSYADQSALSLAKAFVAVGANPDVGLDEQRDAEVLRFFVGLGADIEARNEYGQTPLIYAAWMGEPEAVRTLLELGADVRATTEPEGPVTALHFAAGSENPDREGPIECVRLLLQAGADVHARDSQGNTPLHWSMFESSPECARLLLAAGADANHRNQWGLAPLGWLLDGYENDDEYFAQKGRILLEYGADPAIPMSDGRSVVEAARARENPDGTGVFSRVCHGARDARKAPRVARIGRPHSCRAWREVTGSGSCSSCVRCC